MQMKRPSAAAAGAGQHRKLKKAASYPSLGKAAADDKALQEVPAMPASSRAFARRPIARQNSTQQPHPMSPAFSPVFDMEMEAARGGMAGGASGMDRCRSELSFGDGGANGGGGSLPQILQLCMSSSPFTSQLWQQVHRLRAAHSAAGAVDVDAVARELLGMGYLVQLRDEAQAERPRDARACLQNLRHRFIVCIGARLAPPHADDAAAAWASAATAAGGSPPLYHNTNTNNGGSPPPPPLPAPTLGPEEPMYLPEPLIVEPRLREQFTIAASTPAYDAALASLPPCFVGPPDKLAAVVSLLCAEMHAAFRAQGLPVPPWRTRPALLSKWCPAQLAALKAKIAHLRAAQADEAWRGAALRRGGARPASAGAPPHAAFGSAPAQCSEQQEGGDGAAAAAFADAQRLPPGAASARAAEAAAAMLAEMGSAGAVPGAAAPPPQLFVSAAAAVNSMDGRSPCPAMTMTPEPPPMQPLVWHHDGAAAPLLPPAAGVAPPMPPPPASPEPMDSDATAAVLLRGAAALGLASPLPPLPEAATPPPGAFASPTVTFSHAAPPPPHTGTNGTNGGASPSLHGVNSSTLEFARKASAEWKKSAATGRKAKGLLAAALKRSGSRGECRADERRAASALSSHGGGDANGGIGGGGGGGHGGAAIRTSGDEPWARITTVRWGAYAGAGSGGAAGGGAGA